MSEAVLLEPRLDVHAAPKLAATLAALPPASTVTVDGSAVTQFGALGVQVLMGAARQFAAAGGRLDLVDLSDRGMEQLSVMGLTPAQVTGGAT